MIKKNWFHRLGFAAAVVLLVAGLHACTKRAALSGFDPVDPVALSRGEEVLGVEQYSASREGELYLFANAENQAAFEAAPEKYSIQNRYCLVGPTLLGDSTIFEVHDEKIYIFATEVCKSQFRSSPYTFVDFDESAGN